MWLYTLQWLFPMHTMQSAGLPGDLDAALHCTYCHSLCIQYGIMDRIMELGARVAEMWRLLVLDAIATRNCNGLSYRSSKMLYFYILGRL